MYFSYGQIWKSNVKIRFFERSEKTLYVISMYKNKMKRRKYNVYTKRKEVYLFSYSSK